jgi:cyclopropane fatty-acyl-phospholipid synthase-like methyltransferase
MEDKQYTSDFFEVQMPISMRSAKIILPKIFEVFRPNSILDIGCGTGVWLKVAQELGVDEIIGIDGDYVNRDSLAIAEKNFVAKDLKESFDLNRSFDLVISSEVAEHLPLSVAEQFVSTLTKHSDFILFSAAVPGQGGTYHINEQPQQFWVDQFFANGYLPIDLLRKDIWTAPGVDWWYKQNMFLFVKESKLQQDSSLLSLYNSFKKSNYNMSHPEMIYHQKGINTAFQRFMEAPIYSVQKLLKYYLGKNG